MIPVRIHYSPVSQQATSKLSIATINIFIIVFLAVYLLSDLMFMPVILYNLISAIKQFSNVLEFVLMLVLLLAKFSLLASEIYGIFMAKTEKMKSTMALVCLLICCLLLLLLVAWIVILVMNSATLLMVMTDPITLYILIGVALGIPGVLCLYLS